MVCLLYSSVVFLALASSFYEKVEAEAAKAYFLISEKDA